MPRRKLEPARSRMCRTHSFILAAAGNAADNRCTLCRPVVPDESVLEMCNMHSYTKGRMIGIALLAFRKPLSPPSSAKPAAVFRIDLMHIFKGAR